MDKHKFKKAIDNLRYRFSQWILKTKYSQLYRRKLSIFLSDSRQKIIESEIKRMGKYQIPKGDDLKLLNLYVYELIPLEEKDIIFRKLLKVFEQNKYNGQIPVNGEFIAVKEAEEKINKFDHDLLTEGYYPIGRIYLNAYISDNISYIDISAIKMSESLAALSINAHIRDDNNLILRNLFDKTHLYTFSSKNVPSVEIELKNRLEVLIESLYLEINDTVLKKINGFFNKNHMDHPYLCVYKYKRNEIDDKTFHKNNQKRDFWELFDFYDYGSYLSDDKTMRLIIPSRFGFTSDKPNVVKYNLFINEEKVTVPDGWVNLSNYINLEIRSWERLFAPFLIMEAFAENNFPRISDLKNKIYQLVIKKQKKALKKINKKYVELKYLIHYFERLHKEIKIDDERIRFLISWADFPNFTNKRSFSNDGQQISNFVKDKKSAIEYKYQRCQEILDFIESNLDEYFQFNMAISNLYIQEIMFWIALIALFFGAISIFGFDGIMCAWIYWGKLLFNTF